MKTKINNLFQTSNNEDRPLAKKPYTIGQKSTKKHHNDQNDGNTVSFPEQIKKK